MMKSFIRVCLFGVVLSLFVCSNVKAVSNYYFSVDIGSDLEVILIIPHDITC